jgi:hypothetical protein
MTLLPTDPGVVLLSFCLRDPDEIPWGRGAPLTAPLPCGPCPHCHGHGWLAVPDPFLGDTLDVRCTCGSGA